MAGVSPTTVQMSKEGRYPSSVLTPHFGERSAQGRCGPGVAIYGASRCEDRTSITDATSAIVTDAVTTCTVCATGVKICGVTAGVARARRCSRVVAA